MSSPFATYPVPERSFIPANPARQAGTPSRGTGAKRGRKPKGSIPTGGGESSRPAAPSPSSASSPTTLQWSNVQTNATAGPSASTSTITFSVATTPNPNESSPIMPTQPSMNDVTSPDANAQLSSELGSVLALPGVMPPPAESSTEAVKVEAPVVVVPGAEEDVDGEDEMLPAMADDDYSAQLSFQSQSKDNLKVLMDNFSSAQYDRFEAYRRHALPKQAVRKVIQQTLGQQVSQPVAQIVAGFGKVFVGEIVEKAREVQARRGETGPLSPDHLREAHRMYQQETGRVGAARPLKGKKVFVR
ncbi:hypothetical protein QCA50_015117 [Cerrena zonata]|uniref:Transcription initiation factor TFIID subunit 11 n=1 Tax=Cerrena zonata TaxID=2478898 RepID=A0AAW0FS95_9APHY